MLAWRMRGGWRLRRLQAQRNRLGSGTTGSANTTGNCRTRIVRGGSWGSGPRFLSAASRGIRARPADLRNTRFGFRVARTLAHQSAPPSAAGSKQALTGRQRMLLFDKNRDHRDASLRSLHRTASARCSAEARAPIRGGRSDRRMKWRRTPSPLMSSGRLQSSMASRAVSRTCARGVLSRMMTRWTNWTPQLPPPGKRGSDAAGSLVAGWP